MRWPATPSSAPQAGAPSLDEAPPHAPLLDAMGFDPMTLDALVARSSWNTSTLNLALLELELDGVVARLPGQLFQRRPRACPQRDKCHTNPADSVARAAV